MKAICNGQLIAEDRSRRGKPLFSATVCREGISREFISYQRLSVEGHSQLLHAEGGRKGEQECRLVLPGAFERSAADQRSRGILEGR